METIAYTDLDATEEYWPLENTCDNVDNSNQSVTPRPRQGHVHNTKTPIHRITQARPSQHIFNVSVHGIR